MVLGGLHVKPWGGGDGEPEPAHVHLLFHQTGFFVVRLTLASASFGAWRPSTFGQFRCLNDAVWKDTKLEWVMPVEDVPPLRCGVRDVMDVLFLTLCDTADPAERARRAVSAVGDPDARYGHVERLVSTRCAISAYPVVFGTHYELGWRDAAVAEQQRPQACALARGDEGGGMTAVKTTTTGKQWLLGENQSVLLGAPDDLTPLAAHDPLRMQLVEFMTLQRGAFRWVQRESQRVITEAATVEREDVAAWTRVVAALSDDYVLHDRVAAVLEPVQRHLCEERDLRDPAELERQVRANLATFGSALEQATVGASVVLSLLFGIVAAVALTEPLHRALAVLFGVAGGADGFTERYEVGSLLLDVAFVVVLAGVFAFVYRRQTRVRF